MSHRSKYVRIIGVLLLVVVLSACQAPARTPLSLQVTPSTEGNAVGFTLLVCPLGALPERYSMALSMRQVKADSIGDTALLISPDYAHYYDDIYVVPDSFWQDASEQGAGCSQAILPAVLPAASLADACAAKYVDFKLIVTTFDEHGTPITAEPALPVWDCQAQG